MFFIFSIKKMALLSLRNLHIFIKVPAMDVPPLPPLPVLERHRTNLLDIQSALLKPNVRKNGEMVEFVSFR